MSWSAVIAGAFVTAALYLLLLSLGAGLGLSSVSVWSNQGVSASTFGTASILWIIFVEIVSSAMGGYLAGRLRTRWTVIHGDEVYFRDTAHGFLSWSAALVVTAAVLGSAATVMIGASSSEGGLEGKATQRPNSYFVDSILRNDTSKPEADSAAVYDEVATIFASSLKHGDLTGPDKSYLGHLVSVRTGLSQSDADQRVSDTYAALKQATEAARKSTAHTLLWIFIALLIGAFCASFAGTIGGKQRDKVVIL
ncbi:hypothetical protein HDF16_005269 [Granulicella aggregans]|uniref:Uncharacterized protein n=1 Tax=Granulicella aggregans TaxID=474949 RepID=A0A7W7ZIK0_9BACT|nr:hypothetical protein [Granulicella aggregans]MBB5060533.1 hypothetical protein [Granulicella aggregans]